MEEDSAVSRPPKPLDRRSLCEGGWRRRVHFPLSIINFAIAHAIAAAAAPTSASPVKKLIMSQADYTKFFVWFFRRDQQDYGITGSGLRVSSFWCPETVPRSPLRVSHKDQEMQECFLSLLFLLWLKSSLRTESRDTTAHGFKLSCGSCF